MGYYAFLKKSHGKVIFEIFQYTAIDRELRELSKSLFTFDPAIRFHREKSMTKGGPIILTRPVVHPCPRTRAN